VIVAASLVLVLVGTGLLMLGLLGDGGLLLILLSIGCSVAAAVLLAVRLQRGPLRSD
jgi:hypothetical protein